jgi:adenosylcobinamide-GDP ribazoletransferase
MRKAWVAIRLAIASLTIWPIRLQESDGTAENLALSRYAFPFVGAAIGLFLATLSVGLARGHLSPQIAAFLLVAASATISGGLHLDGLADTFDGLFLGGEPDRRLAVMRDPHIGTFGVIALVLVLLGKFAALSAMSASRRAPVLIAACVVSRCMILVASAFAPYARPEGTGRIVIEATKRRDGIVAIVLSLAVSALALRSGGVIACLGSLSITFVLTALAVRRIKGVTGDILGAVVELGEMVYLASLSELTK